MQDKDHMNLRLCSSIETISTNMYIMVIYTCSVTNMPISTHYNFFIFAQQICLRFLVHSNEHILTILSNNALFRIFFSSYRSFYW